MDRRAQHSIDVCQSRVTILTALAAFTRAFTKLDAPIDVTESVEAVRCELRVGPHDLALVGARALLRTGALRVVGLYDWYDSDASLYEALVFEHGRAGLLNAIERATEAAKLLAAESVQPRLQLVGV